MVHEELWGYLIEAQTSYTRRVSAFLVMAYMHLRIQPLFHSFRGLKPRPILWIHHMKMQGAYAA